MIEKSLTTVGQFSGTPVGTNPEELFIINSDLLGQCLTAIFCSDFFYLCQNFSRNSDCNRLYNLGSCRLQCLIVFSAHSRGFNGENADFHLNFHCHCQLEGIWTWFLSCKHPFKLTHALEACLQFNGSSWAQLGNTKRIFN